MKRILFINALILIVTSFLFNTVGITFRVYLSNHIGTEGMGLFQLIISIYMMATLFVVNGINIAVTRLVAEEGGRKSFSVSRALLIKAFSISFLFSIPAFSFLFFGAEYIGTEWLHDTRTIFSLKLLAAGMPFMGISSCIKGYFNAVIKLLRPAVAQAIELIIQIVVIMSILDYFMSGGLEYACAAIVLGITIAELSSCLFLLTLYWLEKNKNDSLISEIFYQRRVLKKLLYIALPISASSLMRSGLKALENIMIPIGFVKFGYSRKLSLEEYGKIQGMVMPILLFPASILLAFSTLLIPEISEAIALKHHKRVNYSVTRALQLTFLMSILVSGIFFIYSKDLGVSIYNSEECGVMMKILAPIVPVIYLDIVVDEFLKGLNQQVSSLKYNMLDAAIRIVLIYYLIPLKGVPGFIFVLYVSNILNTGLSIQRLLRVTKVKFRLMDWIIKPILSVSACGFIVIYILDKVGFGYLPHMVCLILGVTFVCSLYVFLLILLNCITQDDIKWFLLFFNFAFKS
ncbi:MAG: polysaccharide biosynthesis C-terminal domain-containing protein [Bacillota bacterium]